MAKSGKLGTQRKASGQRKRIAPNYKSIFQGIGLTIIIAYLFYKSVLGLLVGVVIVPFWVIQKSKEKAARDKARIAIEFKEFMMLIVSSLQAGYSLEKAVKQAEGELNKLYPIDSILLQQVHLMNQKVTMNIQLEQAFDEFARAIELEEAISLAEIIMFAKRSGGDYGKHIRDTALKIEDNLSIKQEIETITTEKRLELKVMCIMPMGILAYISFTSESFIAPLYSNPVGVSLMTICLLAYGFFVAIGGRIIDIRV